MGWITDPDHQLQCFLFAKKKTLQKLLFLEKHDKKKKKERERKLHCGDVCSMKLSGSSRQQRERERDDTPTAAPSGSEPALYVNPHTQLLFMMLKACRVAHTAASIHTAFCIYMREEPDSLLSSSPSETNIINHQIRFFLSSTL